MTATFDAPFDFRFGVEMVGNVQFDGNLPLARGAVLLVHRQSPQKVCVKEVRHALIMARTCGIRCVSVGCLI